MPEKTSQQKITEFMEQDYIKDFEAMNVKLSKINMLQKVYNHSMQAIVSESLKERLELK